MGRQLDAERLSPTPRKGHLIIEMLRIKYYRNALCVGCHLFEEFHSLGRHFIRQKCNAGEILTWPSQRVGNSRAHRAIANATDDGYAAFACLEQRLDNIAADGEQKVGFLRDKFGG